MSSDGKVLSFMGDVGRLDDEARELVFDFTRSVANASSSGAAVTREAILEQFGYVLRSIAQQHELRRYGQRQLLPAAQPTVPTFRKGELVVEYILTAHLR